MKIKEKQARFQSEIEDCPACSEIHLADAEGIRNLDCGGKGIFN